MIKYKSVFSTESFIDENKSVVTLLRKPHGSSPEHAFIMVESLNAFNYLTISRYDFVMDLESKDKGKVLIKTQAVTQENAEKVLKDDLLDREEIVGLCWSISRRNALLLHQKILNSKEDYQKNPHNYNLLGDVASFPKSADGVRETQPNSGGKTIEFEDKSSEKTSGCFAPLKAIVSPAGQSCYTWAREMLLSIDDPQIAKRLPRSPLDLVASVTSSHLNSPKKPSFCNIM